MAFNLNLTEESSFKRNKNLEDKDTKTDINDDFKLISQMAKHSLKWTTFEKQWSVGQAIIRVQKFIESKTK